MRLPPTDTLERIILALLVVVAFAQIVAFARG